MIITNTPKPPYYIVIFTSLRTPSDHGCDEMTNRIVELAEQQGGFLRVESVSDCIGITVSYWSDLEPIKALKMNSEHQIAQKEGSKSWYSGFRVRISKEERGYAI